MRRGRAVREESGLEISNPHLHGLLIFPDFKAANWYVFVFNAEKFNGDRKRTVMVF
jgi:hypothetical protein